MATKLEMNESKTAMGTTPRLQANVRNLAIEVAPKYVINISQSSAGVHLMFIVTEQSTFWILFHLQYHDAILSWRHTS